jgi:hypothetical protein
VCFFKTRNVFNVHLFVNVNIRILVYKSIILPVVLYRCETWSLTLREEHRLRVFENRVLRRIFGPKRNHSGAVQCKWWQWWDRL